jgi:hypothetical protein
LQACTNLAICVIVVNYFAKDTSLQYFSQKSGRYGCQVKMKVLLYIETYLAIAMSIDQLSNTEIVALFLDKWAIASRWLADASWSGYPCTHEEWEKLKQKAASIEDAANEVKSLKGSKIQRLGQDKTIQTILAELFPEPPESAEEAPKDDAEISLQEEN